MASTTFEKPLDNDVSAISTNLGSPSSASEVTGADAFSKINTLNSNLANKVTLGESYYGASTGSHAFTLAYGAVYVLFIGTYGADNRCAEYMIMQGSSGNARIHGIKTDAAYTVSSSGNVVTVASTAQYWYARLIAI